MPSLVYPHNLVNGSLADADEVMANFNAAATLLNGGLDDDNISDTLGLSESGSNITMDTVSGHTHNGVDSALLAFAVDGGNQGAVKVKRATVSAVAVDTFTADLNAGYMKRVLGVLALWQTFPGGAAPTSPGDPHHIHTLTPAGGGTPSTVWTTRHYGLYNDGTLDTGYWLELIPGDTITADQVYIYNSFGTTGDVANLMVNMIGVD